MTLPEDGVIDTIAIELACRGALVPLTERERLLAVQHLLDRGTHTTGISRLLHISGTAARDLVAEAQQEAA